MLEKARTVKAGNIVTLLSENNFSLKKTLG
jgi:hypothetical protein